MPISELYCAHTSHSMVWTVSTTIHTERFLKLVLSKIDANKGWSFRIGKKKKMKGGQCLTSVPVLGSIAVRRHHDHGKSYWKKAFHGLLTLSEGQPIINLAPTMALEQQLKATSWSAKEVAGGWHTGLGFQTSELTPVTHFLQQGPTYEPMSSYPNYHTTIVYSPASIGL